MSTIKERLMIPSSSLGKIIYSMGIIIMVLGTVITVYFRIHSNIPTFGSLIGNWGIIFFGEGIVLDVLGYVRQKYRDKFFLKFVMFIVFASPILCTMGIVGWFLYQNAVLSKILGTVGSFLIMAVVYIIQPSYKQIIAENKISPLSDTESQ